MSLAEAVGEALGISQPEESQQRVHELVARHLDSISGGAEIKTTGYFNHAWIPDLVARRRDADERPIFLRFEVNDESFDDDLDHLATERPFFLDIARRESQSRNGNFDLAAALSVKGRDAVLVSEVNAIDCFETSVEEDHEAKVATREVVVGGKGVVDPSAASSIVRSWREAKQAAGSAKSDRLRSSLQKIEAFLDRISSLDLESELRSTWMAAGHDVNTFPGSEDWELNDRSPREIAELVASLLDQAAEVSPRQWAEIGSAISATALGHELAQLGAHSHGGKVNDMIRGGLEKWTAQYAYVPTLDSDSLTGAFDWSVGQYALAVNLIRRKAYFTDIGRKWARMQKARSLPDIRDRLAAFDGGDVLGAGIETPEENVSHELRSTATRSLAEHLEPFVQGQAAWRIAHLRWLELRVPGTDLTARVDFQRNVVRADSTIPIRTFVMLVAKYVAALNDEELERLESSLSVPLRK